MREARSRSRRRSASPPRSSSAPARRSFFGRRRWRGWRSTIPFSGSERDCLPKREHGCLPKGERGYLLAAALPLLLTLLLGLAGFLKLAARAQAAVALQARLDVCAVKLATHRGRSLARLAEANGVLRLTVVGIYAARGAKAAGPVGAVLGGASEAVLLRMNQGLGLFQAAELARASAAEAALLPCRPGRWSREPAACLATPPLATALRREPTLFPAVSGPLVHRERQGSLARVRCRGGRKKTTLDLHGSRDLRNTDFNDEYTE